MAFKHILGASRSATVGSSATALDLTTLVALGKGNANVIRIENTTANAAWVVLGVQGSVTAASATVGSNNGAIYVAGNAVREILFDENTVTGASVIRAGATDTVLQLQFGIQVGGLYLSN